MGSWMAGYGLSLVAVADVHAESNGRGGTMEEEVVNILWKFNRCLSHLWVPKVLKNHQAQPYRNQCHHQGSDLVITISSVGSVTNENMHTPSLPMNKFHTESTNPTPSIIMCHRSKFPMRVNRSQGNRANIVHGSKVNKDSTRHVFVGTCVIVVDWDFF